MTGIYRIKTALFLNSSDFLYFRSALALKIEPRTLNYTLNIYHFPPQYKTFAYQLEPNVVSLLALSTTPFINLRSLTPISFSYQSFLFSYTFFVILITLEPKIHSTVITMAVTGMISSQIHLHPTQRFEPSSEEFQCNYYNATTSSTSQSNLKTSHPRLSSKRILSPITVPSSMNVLQDQQALPLSPPQTPKPPSGCNKTASARYLENYTFPPQFSAKYSIGEELGSGGFGFVVSAIQKPSRREVAVKFIFRDKVPVHAWANDADLGMIPMEIYVLKNVKHSSIIAFLDAYQDSGFFYLVMELHGTQWSATNPQLVTPESRLSKLAAATEQQQLRSGLSNLGPPTPPEEPYSFPEDEHGQPRPNLLVRRTSCDLFECIDYHSKFSENLAKRIFRQIIECVSYLNDIGVCHRDIKDENIVIDNSYVVSFDLTFYDRLLVFAASFNLGSNSLG